MLLNNKGKSKITWRQNESKTALNLWETAKAVLKGKSVAIQTYIKKQEKSQTTKLIKKIKQSNLTSKGTRKRTKSKTHRRRKIVKIRAEIIETKNKTNTKNSRADQ